MADLLEKRDALLHMIQSWGSCAVAFSGGVDSAVVAQAAYFALADQAIAVTGRSASVSAAELDDAVRVAKHIGIRHEILDTNEFANPDYVRNAPDRCFHCKTELYSRLDQIAVSTGAAVVANGANVDDIGDYRPGMKAAANHHVRSPLLECGFTKQDVRDLAAQWGLPVWDKPASPCLSSRVAYGEEVTPERLRMIERAESFLRELGFRVCRVRYHKGDLARIEVDAAELDRLLSPDMREAVVAHTLQVGFKFVTIDLAGFRSGSMNSLVSLQSARDR